MKWIKFDDMKPAVGMYVFVTTRGNVSILMWEKEYNENESLFVSVYSDTWPQPREIYALDFWAPVSFFEEHLPDAFEQEDLKEDEDWYSQNKTHPNIEKIKQITEELSKKSESELREMIKTDYGASAYGYLKQLEISKLFEQINHPNREVEKLAYEKAQQEYFKSFANEALLSVKVPNLIENISASFLVKKGNRTLKLIRYEKDYAPKKEEEEIARIPIPELPTYIKEQMKNCKGMCCSCAIAGINPELMKPIEDHE
jgi:hypothetical protein